MTVLHSGTSKKFSANWASAFGETKTVKKAAPSKKKAAPVAKKKAAAKKAAKKKGTK